MKQNHLLLGAALVAASLSACNNSNSVKKDVDVLSMYVDSVDRLTPVYTETSWADIDRGYQEREMQVEKNMDKLPAEQVAMVDASKSKYAMLKTKYETKITNKEAEASKPDYRTVLRSNLFGVGKIGNDVKFGWVTADNIKDVYEKFVNTVDDHKNDYTREDWDEIKSLYEGLDSRKNEVEKNLSTKDNLKIAGLKIKFAAIKSVKRPVAKAEENSKSKK